MREAVTAMLIGWGLMSAVQVADDDQARADAAVAIAYAAIAKDAPPPAPAPVPKPSTPDDGGAKPEVKPVVAPPKAQAPVAKVQVVAPKVQVAPTRRLLWRR